MSLLQSAFKRFLPSGAANPFEGLAGRDTNDADTIHRMPFTAAELQALIEAAQGDDMMRDLVTAAACTGMRRGDLCRLRWNSVDLAAGMLAVKTSKTGATVEIPIFDPLRVVLETRNGNQSEFVFPEAAAMLAQNESGLTWRFKKIVALTLDTNPSEPRTEVTPAADIEPEALAAIEANTSDGLRRTRMLEAFKRYASGQSYREIEKETGIPRGVLSADLRAVEAWMGKRFVKSSRGPNLKEAIARVTRVERKQGAIAASVRDWHALRTSFVSLALSAGVPMELVRRVTGHATVDIVLKHYRRQDDLPVHVLKPFRKRRTPNPRRHRLDFAPVRQIPPGHPR